MLEGCIRGIEDNWFQGRIADSAYELERKQNEGRRIVVGVNAFTDGNDDDPIELLQITHEDEARQLKRLEQVRHERNAAAVDAALARLATEAADPEINLMPALIDAVNTYATLGEMMAALGDRVRPPRRGADDLRATKGCQCDGTVLLAPFGGHVRGINGLSARTLYCCTVHALPSGSLNQNIVPPSRGSITLISVGSTPWSTSC